MKTKTKSFLTASIWSRVGGGKCYFISFLSVDLSFLFDFAFNVVGDGNTDTIFSMLKIFHPSIFSPEYCQVIRKEIDVRNGEHYVG